MANQPHTFEDRDVVRIVRAARKSGVYVTWVSVNMRSGVIAVGTKDTAPTNSCDANPWDRVCGEAEEDA